MTQFTSRQRPHAVALAAIPLCLAALLSACSAPSTTTQEAMPARPTMPTIAPARPVADVQRVLEAYHWDLSATSNAQGQNTLADWTLPNRPALRLSFQENRLSTNRLCNTIVAGYRVDADSLKIDRAASTMMACNEPGLMALERRVGEQLAQVRGYSLVGGEVGGRTPPMLTLRTADGSRWQFTGMPTSATRYGSAGERVFMEVAPQLVACNNPMMRNAQCLRVRDLTYDAPGLKRVTSEWRVMQGGIEGYEHRAGVRNVLRLQRYSLARNGQLPADGPSHAYVLDIAVETEQVR